jgi:hypothetical protein
VSSSGRGRVNGEDKGGYTWSMYFIYLYEKRTLKLVEVILSKGEREEGE